MAVEARYNSNAIFIYSMMSTVHIYKYIYMFNASASFRIYLELYIYYILYITYYILYIIYYIFYMIFYILYITYVL